MKTETKRLLVVGIGGIMFGVVLTMSAVTFAIYRGHPPSYLLSAAAQGTIVTFGMFIGPIVGPYIRSRRRARSIAENT
jgi:hypothetical protein